MTPEEYIKTFLDQLPEIVSPEDLIRVGIFRHSMDASRARKKGKSPDYLQLPNSRIIYTKEAIERFLRESYFSGKNPRQLGPTRAGRPRKRPIDKI